MLSRFTRFRSANSLWRRLRRHGPRALIGLVGVNIAHYARRLSPRALSRRASELRFDRAYGIDTAAALPVGAIATGGAADAHASPYVAIDADLLRAVLGALPIGDLSSYSFVDYGSGKGRALFIAAEFAFKRIVGVEYSPLLHQVARKNLAALSRQPGFDRIELECRDATQFPPLPGNLVALFFNPFGLPLMEQVVGAIAAASPAADVHCLYFNAQHPAAFDPGRWDRVTATEHYSIYRRKAAAA